MFEALGIHFRPDILTIIGVLITAAFLGSRIFQRFGIPQVVGFIIIGVLLGPSLLNIIPLALSEELVFISEIALGLIGFDIGSHLRLKELRQLGKSIIFFLLFEAFGAFTLVTLGIYSLTGSWTTALVFGAISSATAPAATVDVLAEYHAKGPLTTTLLCVVGLDDALSLILYSLTAAFAEASFAGSSLPSLGVMLEIPLYEIGGSLILGLALGHLLDLILHRLASNHDGMTISIAFVFLGVGLSQSFGLSLILTAMIMGVFLVNRSPKHTHKIRYTIEQAAPVIYVLFFTLVGARFQVSLLPTMGLLGLAYVILRSVGKYGGAWIGGTLGGASPTVRGNLGLGLLSQAGVAIGLAIASANRFSAYGAAGQALGNLVISVITATTFIVQIVGPMLVKYAIVRSGEINMAVIEDLYE